MKLLNIAGFDVLEANKKMPWDDAMALPAIANEQQAGGFSDWVLPAVDGLKALQSIDEKKEGRFWSSSLLGINPSNGVFLVNFHNCDVYSYGRSDSNRVRLVRAGQCLALVNGTSAGADNAETAKDEPISVEVIGMIAGVAKIAKVLPDLTYDIIGEVKNPSRISVKIGDIVKVSSTGASWQLVG